jgi:hypothetical protein
MSHLDDCRAKLGQLLVEAERVEVSYRQARTLYESLESGQPVDLSGLGMNLVFEGGEGIPIPMTTDRAELAEKVAEAVNFLGRAVVTTWDEIHTTAVLAKQHCDQAAATGQQVEAPSQPTAPQPGSPPPIAPPQAAAEQAPAAPAAAPQPRLTPVRTEPVGGS